jgi:hypothetical protein
MEDNAHLHAALPWQGKSTYVPTFIEESRTLLALHITDVRLVIFGDVNAFVDISGGGARPGMLRVPSGFRS